MVTFARTVAYRADNAQETQSSALVASGFTRTASPLVVQNGTSERKSCAFRFPGVTIPAGSTITSAVLEVYTSSSKADDPALDIYCEDVDDAADFITTPAIHARARTTATTAWVATDIGINAYKASPDFSAAVQEVIDRPGWVGNNALLVILLARFVGTVALWIDNGTNRARLTITYTPPSTVVLGARDTVGVALLDAHDEPDLSTVPDLEWTTLTQTNGGQDIDPTLSAPDGETLRCKLPTIETGQGSPRVALWPTGQAPAADAEIRSTWASDRGDSNKRQTAHAHRVANAGTLDEIAVIVSRNVFSNLDETINVHLMGAAVTGTVAGGVDQVGQVTFADLHNVDPLHVATRLVGNVVDLKVWLDGEEEPEWGAAAPARTYSVTIAEPLLPDAGNHGWYVAHVEGDTQWVDYGEMEVRAFEAAGLDAASDRADTLAAAVDETTTSTSTLDRADTLAAGTTESSTSSSTLDRADTLAAAVDEATASTSTLDRADALAAALEELAAGAGTLDLADTLDLILEEGATIGGTTTLLSRADTVALALDDTATIAATLDLADTLLVAVEEAATATVALHEIDALDVVGLEEVAAQISIAVAEALDLALAEQAHLPQSKAALDALALALVDVAVRTRSAGARFGDVTARAVTAAVQRAGARTAAEPS